MGREGHGQPGDVAGGGSESGSIAAGGRTAPPGDAAEQDRRGDDAERYEAVATDLAELAQDERVATEGQSRGETRQVRGAIRHLERDQSDRGGAERHWQPAKHPLAR